MSDKDPIAYLSSEEAKRHLNQLDVETVQAFSKIFQVLPIQSSGGDEVTPPKTAKEFIEWLSTEAGKKYLGRIDSSSLKSLSKLILAADGGPEIRGARVGGDTGGGPEPRGIAVDRDNPGGPEPRGVRKD